MIKSPCNSICKMNKVTGLCEGCFRTLDEIAKWGMAPDEEKIKILENIKIRNGNLGNISQQS